MPSFDASPSHRLRNLFSLIVVLAIAACAFAWFRGSAPVITAPDLPSAIGGHKLLTFDVHAPVGVSFVEADLVQAGKTVPLGRQSVSPRHWFMTGDAPPVVHFSVQAGKLDHPELADGPAQLIVTARSANLRAATATFARDLRIASTPPRVYTLTTQAYISQGGSSLIVYHVSSGATESGVQMGGVFFPGYPLPDAFPLAGTLDRPGAMGSLGVSSVSGSAGEAGRGPAPDKASTMFCLFAFPYNAPTDSQPQLIARDGAGNQSSTALPVRTTPKKFRSRTLPIDDAFIERVVMPIIANTPGLADQGDPERNFLLVNRTLRRTDTQELVDAAKLTTPRLLWQGAFLQLGNAAVEAVFADHRSYSYHGRIIDQEDHLGYDLAAVRHTPVKAANAGHVIWAKYFGIYGNSVLIDHGCGLMSLYAHLNDFEVKAGDSVTEGQLIAHSDSTGLAGGDHLHFSLLLDGIQVNPLEWWDAHWVKDRIQAPLAEFVAK